MGRARPPKGDRPGPAPGCWAGPQGPGSPALIPLHFGVYSAHMYHDKKCTHLLDLRAWMNLSTCQSKLFRKCEESPSLSIHWTNRENTRINRQQIPWFGTNYKTNIKQRYTVTNGGRFIDIYLYDITQTWLRVGRSFVVNLANMMQPLIPIASEGKCQGLIYHIYGWARSFECCRSFECQFAMLRSFEVRIAKLKLRSFGYFSKQTCGAKRRKKLVPLFSYIIVQRVVCSNRKLMKLCRSFGRSYE